MSLDKNPYAKFLAGKDALEVLTATPARLEAAVARLGAEGMKESYAPGKWTMNMVICHLADCEVAFGYRWRQVVAQTNHLIQPFDQDAWAKHYGEFDAQLALAAFLAARRLNVAWLKTLTAEERSKPVTHPERGELTLQELLQITAGHDGNHLEQFDRLIAAKAV